MTMKTKRALAVGGGTAICAALAVLIATRFAPDDRQLTTSNPSAESKPAVSVEISTAKHEETKPIEIDKPESRQEVKPYNGIAISSPTESDPEKEAADFIEDGGIEIEQNFPEPEKPISTSQSTDTAHNTPPEPPKIEDEEMLTNPDKEPTYEPEQIKIKQQPETPSDTPKHGEKKDGMIYINGFGWIKDEGGGGRAEYASDMYENGNKIGYFG